MMIRSIFQLSIAGVQKFHHDLDVTFRSLLETSKSDVEDQNAIIQLLINQLQELKNLELPRNLRVGLFEVNCEAIRRTLSLRIRQRRENLRSLISQK